MGKGREGGQDAAAPFAESLLMWPFHFRRAKVVYFREENDDFLQNFLLLQNFHIAIFKCCLRLAGTRGGGRAGAR